MRLVSRPISGLLTRVRLPSPLFLTFAAFALALVAAGVSTAAETDAVRAVASALRAGRFPDAVRLATEALASDPRNPQLLTLRGLAFSKSGDASAAIRSFDEALHVAPGYVPALKAAAELQFQNAGPGALPYLDRLLKIQPGDETAHAMRAVIAWKQHDCATAVLHFRAAPHAIAAQPAALYDYGACLLRLGKPKDAEDIFTRLHSLRPRDRQAAQALAATQMSNAHYQAAIDTLQPFLSAGAPDADALQIASAAHEALGQTPQAVELLRNAILAAPERAGLYVQFASLCLDHKSFQVGIDMIDAGLPRVREPAKLYLARGVLYVQQGNYEAADKDFTRAELLRAPEGAGAGARALSEFQANHLDQALQTVETHLKKDDHDAFFHYLLAEILIKRGSLPGTPDFARAVAAVKQAVALRSNFVLARNLLSRLYLESGQTELAIKECRQTLAIEPQDETALYRLIRALKSSGVPNSSSEIRDLVTRLSEARRAKQKHEAEASRYRLVEEAPETH